MPTIKELVEEAEENYATERYVNSSQLFKRAAIEVIDRAVIDDGLYLAYRAIKDFQLSGQYLDKYKFMNTLSEKLLISLSTQISQLLDSGIELDNLLSILDLQQQALDQLGKEEQRDTVIDTMISLLQKEYEDTNSIDNVSKIYELQPNDDNLLLLLIALYEDAILHQDDDIFDGKLVMASKLIQSLSHIDPSELRIEPDISIRTSDATTIQNIVNLILGKLKKIYEETDEETIRSLIDRYNQQWILPILHK